MLLRQAVVAILNHRYGRISWRILVMKIWKLLFVFAALLLPSFASPQTATPAEARRDASGAASPGLGDMPSAAAWRGLI